MVGIVYFGGNAGDIAYVLLGVAVCEPGYECCTVCERFHEFVVRRYCWVGDVFVLELHCVAETIAPCVFDVTFVCAIMFRRGG